MKSFEEKISTYLNGDMSRDESTAFIQECDNDPAMRAELQAQEEINEMLNNNDDMKMPADVSDKIVETCVPAEKVKPKSTRWRLLKIAAILLMLLIPLATFVYIKTGGGGSGGGPLSISEYAPDANVHRAIGTPSLEEEKPQAPPAGANSGPVLEVKSTSAHSGEGVDEVVINGSVVTVSMDSSSSYSSVTREVLLKDLAKNDLELYKKLKEILDRQSNAPGLKDITKSNEATRNVTAVDSDIIENEELTTSFVYPDPEAPSSESYEKVVENKFKDVGVEPLSTFSVDVDSASYSNVRRFLNMGQLPPPNSVRIEELVNYFDYDYPTPTNEEAFSVYTELGESPWHEGYKLVHIGLKGREIAVKNLPAMNLVFLIDVSGSMSSANKLPLVKSSMKLLAQQLRKQDHVAIVVYAGAAGVVLPSTSGADKQTILNALNQLNAGGSTAGGAGIDLAYKIASQHMIDGGINRVILATDGDFNVGTSGTAALGTMIEGKRDSGIYFSVFGFGMGNYKDDKLETLSNKGNGNYGYIDTYSEAQKVFVQGMAGTLATIATDVKIQVEFNPHKVASYRLLGYVNRMLKKEDFNNDKKDAGEIGAGHTVTALYEIIPVGVAIVSDVDPLKYQDNPEEKKEAPKANNTTDKPFSDEMLTVKIRHKDAVGAKSSLLSSVVKDSKRQATSRFRFANAVAGFGLLLRQSPNKGTVTYAQVIKEVKATMGADENGYRHELLKLIEAAQQLQK